MKIKGSHKSTKPEETVCIDISIKFSTEKSTAIQIEKITKISGVLRKNYIFQFSFIGRKIRS